MQWLEGLPLSGYLRFLEHLRIHRWVKTLRIEVLLSNQTGEVGLAANLKLHGIQDTFKVSPLLNIGNPLARYK